MILTTISSSSIMFDKAELIQIFLGGLKRLRSYTIMDSLVRKVEEKRLLINEKQAQLSKNISLEIILLAKHIV